MPGGSLQATAHYGECALEAGTAFVNCNPDVIAGNADWQARYMRAGVPLLGDDVKSQMGSTIFHRTLLELCTKRGIHIDRSYQLGYGGNTDFLNMKDRTRFASKLAS